MFFDLVFVLAVAQVAHVLSEHSDAGETLKFLALLAPVWWVGLRETILDFLESAYQAGAKRAGWDVEKFKLKPLK